MLPQWYIHAGTAFVRSIGYSRIKVHGQSIRPKHLYAPAVFFYTLQKRSHARGFILRKGIPLLYIYLAGGELSRNAPSGDISSQDAEHGVKYGGEGGVHMAGD